jgi:hypothetical protein
MEWSVGLFGKRFGEIGLREDPPAVGCLEDPPV